MNNLKKKPSPTYLAELEKIKCRKRNYEPIDFSWHDEEDWRIFINSSHEEINMRKFVEEEEYWNDIPKVKQELRDHPTHCKRVIVWVCSASIRGTVYDFNFVYNQDYDGDVEMEGYLPDIIGVERLQEELCERFQIGEESISGGDSGSEEEEEDTNAWIIRAFKEKAEQETNPYKKKAWENATTALDNISLTIHSVEDVKNVKGLGKSSYAFLQGLFENREISDSGTRETFASLPEEVKTYLEDISEKSENETLTKVEDFFKTAITDLREAIRWLPEHIKICLDEDGVLCVNGLSREYFYAKGCPLKSTLNGYNCIIDGTAQYDGFSDACAGLIFDGIITMPEWNDSEMNFHFEYNHNDESIETKVSDSYFDFDEEDLKELAQEIIDKYEWPFQE